MLLINGKRKDNLAKMPKAVEFKLLNGFTSEDPRVLTAQGNPHIRKNAIFRLPTVYVKFDKGLNQNVEYRYAVQEIPIKTGKDEGTIRYTPDKIVFISTSLVVKTDKPDLYEFLKESPWIEGNGNTKPLFKEMNPVATAQNRVEKESLRIKALRLIVDDGALPDITLRRILSSTGDNGDYDIDIVKDKLIAVAEKDPRAFINSIGSKDTELKALISELTDKGYIGFNAIASQWQWGEKTADNGNKITSTPQGKNETDWLIETLLRDEALLKSFKSLSKEKPVDPNKDEIRLALESKAKKLKCGQGMFHADNKKLQQKIDFAIAEYKKELDSPKSNEQRKKYVSQILEEIGELVPA